MPRKEQLTSGTEAPQAQSPDLREESDSSGPRAGREGSCGAKMLRRDVWNVHHAVGFSRRSHQLSRVSDEVPCTVVHHLSPHATKKAWTTFAKAIPSTNPFCLLFFTSWIVVFTVSSFGDQYRAYLRGQLTIHKNRPHVNRVWMRCSHLTHYSERLEVGAIERSGLLPRLFLLAGRRSFSSRQPPEPGDAYS